MSAVVESEGDGATFTFNIKREGSQVAITGTMPAATADAIGDAFPGAQVFAKSLAATAKVAAPTAALAPPPLKGGISLETLSHSLVNEELSTDEKSAILLAVEYEKQMKVGETRYAIQHSVCRWERTDQSHAQNVRQVYASVTRTPAFGPHIEYHVDRRWTTFAESEPGKNAAVGYQTGAGLSTGAGIKNESVNLKLFGTGISLGRNMGISFLGSEVKADLINSARKLSLDQRSRTRKSAKHLTEPGQFGKSEDGTSISHYDTDEYEDQKLRT